MNTDLAACDTYRNAQSDQERPGYLDYKSRKQELYYSSLNHCNMGNLY